VAEHASWAFLVLTHGIKHVVGGQGEESWPILASLRVSLLH
jgi:hypothetical protein